MIVVTVTQHEAIDRQPSFSPDGSKILFASDRFNPLRFGLLTMRPDGSDLTTYLDPGPNTGGSDYLYGLGWTTTGHAIYWVSSHVGGLPSWIVETGWAWEWAGTESGSAGLSYGPLGTG